MQFAGFFEGNFVNGSIVTHDSATAAIIWGERMFRKAQMDWFMRVFPVSPVIRGRAAPHFAQAVVSAVLQNQRDFHLTTVLEGGSINYITAAVVMARQIGFRTETILIHLTDIVGQDTILGFTVEIVQ